MKDLIAKLEAATEGSRELDAGICAALRWPVSGKGTVLPAWVHDNFPEWEITKEGRLKAGCLWEPVPFTTSLDAALTLVPEGFTWRVQCDRHGNAESWTENNGGDFGGILALDTQTFAATPALALCIAALKARAQ